MNWWLGAWTLRCRCWGRSRSRSGKRGAPARLGAGYGRPCLKRRRGDDTAMALACTTCVPRSIIWFACAALPAPPQQPERLWAVPSWFMGARGGDGASGARARAL